MFNSLTHYIDILVHNGQDSAGGMLPPTVFIGHLAAGVEDDTGKEVHAAGQFASDLAVKFTVRWNPTITAAHLVRFEDAIYTISYTKDPAVSDTSLKSSSRRVTPPRLRHQYLELHCQLFNTGKN